MRVLTTDAPLNENVKNYVVSRQNTDGGYNFVEGDDSNANDTYYALAILQLLDLPFPNVDLTINWLQRFKLGTIYSYYYIGKALSLCGEDLDNRFQKYVVSTIASKRHFSSVDVYVEVASEFRAACMILELAYMLGVDATGAGVVDWLLAHKNGDGGFGAHNYSNINSTYYAAASLRLLNYGVERLHDTVAFLRTCEKPYGGFTVVPQSFAPYMEYTHYGVMAVDDLGEKCKFPSQTIDFVLSCQNANGGFARAEIGISTFENTFQALSIMQKLAPQRGLYQQEKREKGNACFQPKSLIRNVKPVRGFVG